MNRAVREVVSADGAPRAIGPYSQGIRAGPFVFVSGQIPLDPATGKIVEGGIEAQTERVLNNLRAVLEAAGSSLDRVVKTTVYLTNLKQFAAFNETYRRYFPSDPPARATVEVSSLPGGVLIEIDAVALVEAARS